ncbi:MAG: 2OG-Fe(II) oxygenase [Bradymonadaceae bacterium]
MLDLSDPAEMLAKLLSTVTRPGDYYATGTVVAPMPSIEVEGLGPLAFPLLPEQARRLMEVAEPAPYGRGDETLIDADVRRSRQIDPRQLNIENDIWDDTLAAIVKEARSGLGVEDDLSAELYKMLIYEEGGFFVEHRDTEKAPGMFATLVVVLPSFYGGGELVIRHDDRAVSLALNTSSPSRVSYAAFYADCRHELLPVTEGYRLCLVYNLLRRGAAPLPEPPDYRNHVAQVTRLLEDWDEEGPPMLIYPLQHAYTPESLSFDHLKHADQAAAAVLKAAATGADCDLHLAMISIEESGAAEYYGGSYSRGWGRYREYAANSDDFEVGEVLDRTMSLEGWRDADDQPALLAKIAFEDWEISPPEGLENEEADEVHFTEATGNEGASFERTYRRAALVVWPRRNRWRIISRAGLDVTLPMLEELIREGLENRKIEDAQKLGDAMALAASMILSWRHTPIYGRGVAPDRRSRMFDCLVDLEADDLLATFIPHAIDARTFEHSDNAAILAAVKVMGWEKAEQAIIRLIASVMPESLDPCTDLILRLASETSAPEMVRRNVAGALVDVLPPLSEPHEPWRRPPAVEAESISRLLAALLQISSSILDRAVDHILEQPETYGLDGVLVPALLAIPDELTPLARGAAPIDRLREVCLQHLEARISQPLKEPTDWRLPVTLTCPCEDCRALQKFIDSPKQREWTYGARKDRRRHLQYQITSQKCDIDCHTLAQGSPHKLVCKKNRKSYQRRVEQRKADLAALAGLDAMGEG